MGKLPSFVLLGTMHAAQVVATETQYVAKTSYCDVMMCHSDARGVIFNLREVWLLASTN
jgi:hypothetical protein